MRGTCDACIMIDSDHPKNIKIVRKDGGEIISRKNQRLYRTTFLDS